MPVYRLTDELIFPHPSLADPGGLVAVGGDLSPERLLLAYAHGIFPWYSDPSPILWWSPDPRLVLFPGELKISRSLRRVIKKQVFTVTMDSAFGEVIRACAETREETWITGEMIDAYTALHELGYAHSFETRYEGRLVGGLYGVALGRAFFGESMFSAMSDASKVALVLPGALAGRPGLRIHRLPDGNRTPQKIWRQGGPQERIPGPPGKGAGREWKNVNP